jgi:hypothetical protein
MTRATNLLKPKLHNSTTRFNVRKFCIQSTRYLRAFNGSQNKQRLFLSPLFITEAQIVYCAVRIGSLNAIDPVSSLMGCRQRKNLWKLRSAERRRNKHELIDGNKTMRRVHFRYVRVQGMETHKQSERYSWWGLYSVGSRMDLQLQCVGTCNGFWWLRNVSRTIWREEWMVMAQGTNWRIIVRSIEPGRFLHSAVTADCS